MVIQFVLMALVLVLSPLVRQDWGNPITDAAAAGLFALAAVTGLLGVRELRGNRTVFPLPKGGSALITTGIYGYLRHPLYVAVMAMSFGWALAWLAGADDRR